MLAQIAPWTFSGLWNLIGIGDGDWIFCVSSDAEISNFRCNGKWNFQLDIALSELVDTVTGSRPITRRFPFNSRNKMITIYFYSESGWTKNTWQKSFNLATDAAAQASEVHAVVKKLIHANTEWSTHTGSSDPRKIFVNVIFVQRTNFAWEENWESLSDFSVSSVLTRHSTRHIKSRPTQVVPSDPWLINWTPKGSDWKFEEKWSNGKERGGGLDRAMDDWFGEKKLCNHKELWKFII